ncbi:response regulator transcription factor [Geoalkalibacter halelectricus]|uniref:Response regulator transcription factor n=1 Tax=Geoalkalibacter halelectricus TaxID=2847045 RepID=A0ABY5ZNS1_9BACT|nr:response regulator transcription factor [Geoalkalibacter halelectricus]MDO3378527.1 response regulator transcription factor [Geoalkalibacter halelectricus]UWZ80159.1 response regulator transcription factor [Geoalkalibacter halelectricus]
MEPVKFLIAEDNPKDFEFLERLLREEDFVGSIERADNGLAALKMAAQVERPLVISDIQMPEMNGVDFARALWDKRPLARIVFWSQYKDEMYVRALLRIVPPETVYGYVLKSNPRDRIAAAIRTVLIDEQCWIDPEVRKVQGRTGHSQTSLSDIEYEALLDISLGLTDNLIAQRRYLSRRGVQSRLNSLYAKLGIDQEQFHSEKFGDAFNLRNRAVACALRRGLVNAFELENEEQDFQSWLKRFKSSHR